SVRFSADFAFNAARRSSALVNCTSAASRFTVAVDGSALFPAAAFFAANRELGEKRNAAIARTVFAWLKTGETRAKALCKKNEDFSANFMPTGSPNIWLYNNYCRTNRW